MSTPHSTIDKKTEPVVSTLDNQPDIKRIVKRKYVRKSPPSTIYKKTEPVVRTLENQPDIKRIVKRKYVRKTDNTRSVIPKVNESNICKNTKQTKQVSKNTHDLIKKGYILCRALDSYIQASRLNSTI